MLNTKFAPWPSFSPGEIEAVREVLASNRVNYWTGDRCREFETRFAKWCGTDRAIALMNGTVALDLALKAIGVGPGDEVIVTPRTFIASISTVVTAGAIPVFADVDLDTQAISAQTILPVLTPRTKAIIVVHLGGMPADMDPIMALAKKRDLKVIEDCAQAHGAIYKGRRVGSIGHIGAWSFCQDKIMTTGGEGGMVTTNDRGLWSFMWSYKDHGKSREAVYERKHPPGPRLVHDQFGTNWRMLEMQAAIGLVQLGRLQAWTERRNAIAESLAAVCSQFSGIRVPHVAKDITHGYYRFYAFLDSTLLRPGWTRDKVIEAINQLGVPCLHGSASEVYLEAAFDETAWRPATRLKNAVALGESSICFLTHPTLTDADVDTTCAAMEKVFGQALDREPACRMTA